jgi:FMN phosphatase YigB (HAD superfamily)
MLVNQLFEQLKAYDEVIFDLDNTLFYQQDYDRGAFEDIELYLKKLNTVSSSGIANFLLAHKQLKGNKYPKLFNDALSQFHLPANLLAIMLERYTQHDGRYISAEKSLIPSVKKHLTDKKLFVVTNGRETVQSTKLKCLAVEKFAVSFICSPKNSLQLKPSRFAYDELSKQHEFINPVMVGDDLTTDGLFARNCNIPFIHFDISQVDQ